MKSKRSISILLFFLFGQLLSGQSDIPIGKWKSYLPYNTGLFLTQSAEKIIYGTDLAIFTIDKTDFSIEFITKIDGLSETGIQDLEYDNYNDRLIVSYQNSTIDIVSQSDVFSISNIKETDIFQGDKKIYDTYVQNSNYVYFATGFGIVQYDLQKLEFGFTTDAAQKVSVIDGNEDMLVISADDGAYVLDLNILTPNFFGAWQRIENGLPPGYESKSVLVLENKVLLATNDKVYLSTNFQDFEEIYNITDIDHEVRFLEKAESGWMLGLRDPSFNSKVIVFDEADVPIQDITDCINRVREAVVDESGRIFFADDWEGIRYKSSISGPCESDLTFNTPKSQEVSDIDIVDNKVYVASGGVSESFANLFSRQGFYVMEDGQWTNINESNTSYIKTNEVIQHYKIAGHPSLPKVYVGSFWAGLLEYDFESDAFELYNKLNSPLTEPVGDNPNRVKISGLVFDENENLWISNFGAVKPISVLTAEGIWHSFSIPADTKVTDLIVDDLGLIWIVIGGNSGGIVIMDPGDNPSPIFKSSSNSEIPSNTVNSIALDRDGGVWVGTSAGVVLFECGGGLFDNPCNGNKPTVLQDSIGAFLLETEDVLSIEVDGANRKWFGTRNGIFVQSPNAEIQVAKFDVENSPLFDNTIKALEYNPETGEMFIASNKGLQSFRTQTTGSRATHANEVFAFPNPVRPEHSGVIAIKGLATDAEVKITDVDGQLVYHTTALGGQAIWNGKDNKGREVSGGVYLVFSSSSDGFRDPNSYVTKILIVR